MFALHNMTIIIHNKINSYGEALVRGASCARKLTENCEGRFISTYFDILRCNRRYHASTKQYAQDLFLLSGDEKEKKGQELREYNSNRVRWDVEFSADKRFNMKYGSKQYDLTPSLIKKKIKAYNKKFGGGPHFRFVGDSVIIKKQHYLDGALLIGNHVCVSRDVLLDITGFLEIQDDVDISEGTKIYTHKHDLYKLQHLIEPNETQERTVIGKGVWIGANSVIMPGVTIGEYAVIGAGSVVTKNIPAYTVYAGNPAKFIRENKTN